MILHLENENFDQEVSNGLVLVDFYATWCGPCKMLGPVLEELGSARGSYKIIKVDVDKHNDLAHRFGIMSVPTLLYFKDGQVVKTSVGFVTKDVIEDTFNSLN